MDFLISIPGPFFLLYFIIFCGLVMFAVKIISAYDYTSRYNIPEPTTFSPFEIALLRGGRKGALITSVFNLWKQGKIKFTNDKSSLIIERKSEEIVESEFNELENTIFKHVKVPRDYKKLYSRTFFSMYDDILEISLSKLREKKLIPARKVKIWHWIMFFVGFVLIFAIVGLKLYFGVIRDKPIAFLTILLIILFAVYPLIMNPERIRLSALGRKFIKFSSQRFEWLKKEQDPSQLLMDNNLIYGIALFGLSAFTGKVFLDLIGDGVLLEKTLAWTYIESGWHNNGGCSGCSSGCGGGCGGCGGCGG